VRRPSAAEASIAVVDNKGRGSSGLCVVSCKDPKGFDMNLNNSH